MTFPDYAGGSWTARFDSWNQRTDEVFYLVSVDGGEEFCVSLHDTDIPAQLEHYAERGVTNTPYRGYGR